MNRVLHGRPDKRKCPDKERTMRNLIGIIALSLLAAVAAGCASDETSNKNDPTTSTDPENPFAAAEQAITRYTGESDPISNYTLPLRLADSVTVITKRVVDSNITVNGASMGAATKVKKITLAEKAASTANKLVILDYTNGLFAAGTGASSTGIELDAAWSSTDKIGIKGTATADKVVLGKATGYYTIDM